MALSRLLRKQKKTVSAKELIEQAMRQDIGEFAPMNPDDWIRISSIGGLCPREEVLRYRFGIPRTKGVDPNLGLVFESGHAVHWMMQNKVMAATGRIVGSWRCTWCGEVYGSFREGLVPRPGSCIRCGGVAGESRRINNKPILTSRNESFVFAEEWLGNAEYMVGGSPDGYLVDGDPLSFTVNDLVVLEFKSASDSNFVKYEKAPDFMHVIQCQCYMWLTGIKRAKILYLNKGKFGMDGIAEHDVLYDSETVSMVQSAIKEIRIGLAGGAIPPRVACDSPGCPRAGVCDVSKQCFSGVL
jgi:hypothetical protein